MGRSCDDAPLDALASLKPVSVVLKYCMPVLDRLLMRRSRSRLIFPQTSVY
jgi:hypothetical protein